MLIFGDFGENFDFCSNFGFCDIHLWASRALGNRQTNKTMSETEKKVHGDNFRYP